MTRAFWVALALIALAACLGVQSETQRTLDLAPAAHADLLGQANTILEILHDGDFAALSAFVHPQQGIALAPYSRNLSALSAVRFSPGEVAGFEDDDREHYWGDYDGSGLPILLSAEAYFEQFVYDVDYLQRASPSVIEPLMRERGDFDALYDEFPGSMIVRYHFSGTEQVDFIDFRDLILVLDLREDRWWLTALAHAENTV